MTSSVTNDEINGKDIIQTDAAIIAGILILPTISSFSPFEFPIGQRLSPLSFLQLHYSQFLLSIL